MCERNPATGPQNGEHWGGFSLRAPKSYQVFRAYPEDSGVGGTAGRKDHEEEMERGRAKAGRRGEIQS